MQATYIKDEDLKNIETIIFRFIWNIKSTNPRAVGKIRREILKQNICEGGLRAPDIKYINLSIKYKHIIRCQSNNHPVSVITNDILDKMKLNWNDLTVSNPSNKTYLSTAAKSHNLLNIKLNKDIEIMSNEEDGINSGYYAFIQNIRLSTSSLFPNTMTNVIKRITNKNILTLYDLLKEKQRPEHNNIIIDCCLAFYKIPSSYRKILLRAKKRHHQSDTTWLSTSLNKWKPFNTITTKDLYDTFLNITSNSPTIFDTLNKRHNMTVSSEQYKNPFLQIKHISSDPKLQITQYKILHNIYPTIAHLHKWKIKDSPLCLTCNSIDDLKHTLFDCVVAQNTINNLCRVILELTGKPLTLTFEDIVLGVTSRKTFNSLKKQELIIIDKILILLKRSLILQRESKFTLSENEIKTLMSYQYKTELYISKSKNKENQTRISWGLMGI